MQLVLAIDMDPAPGPWYSWVEAARDGGGEKAEDRRAGNGRFSGGWEEEKHEKGRGYGENWRSYSKQYYLRNYCYLVPQY